tara:strand:+ start:895 stop:1155 length:261 start_codon:yes stop_codon:yes gene_type:complete
MENVDAIINGIVSLIALLVSGFAVFKIHQSSQDVKRAEKMVDDLADQAHKVIAVAAEEDHEEVAEALKKDDKAAAIANLFNDRAEK